MRARVVVTSLAMFMGAMLVPGNAFPHALLTKSVPAANARLSTLPTMIRLWYSEEPAIAMTHVVLTDSTGHAVSVGAVEQDESEVALHVRIIGALTAGRYTVAWKTVAADDGHPSQGTFGFVVLSGATSAIVPSTAPLTNDTALGVSPGMTLSATGAGGAPSAETPGYVVARAVTFVALLAAIGLVAFRFLVLQRSAIDETTKEAIHGRAARAGIVAAALLCIAASARLYLQASMLGGPSDPISGTLSTILTNTRWGGVWCLQVGAALGALLGFFIAARGHNVGWAIAAIAAPVLAVGSSLQGHAASAQSPAFAVTIDALHVLGASGWLGSLLCLLVVGFPGSGANSASRWQNIRALVEAFSPTALAFAGLVVLTGLVNAWLRLGSLAPLWTSPYGKVLLVKLVVVLAAGGVGFNNWRRVRPTLGTEVATSRLQCSASAELAIGLLVLIVTAVLVAMQTPLDTT